jgi:hypothetical protein
VEGPQGLDVDGARAEGHAVPRRREGCRVTGWTLAELRHHWGEAYEITGRGRDWRARRRDGKGELTAPDPDALVVAIRADYERCPVPRDAR